MKLWYLRWHNDYSDRGNGVGLAYYPSKRAARADMPKIEADVGDEADFQWFTDGPEAVNVPTDKKGLIDFLNRPYR